MTEWSEVQRTGRAGAARGHERGGGITERSEVQRTGRAGAARGHERGGGPTRLILWRHGQTEWNAADRIQGQADVELSALGRAQAVRAAVRLAELEPDLLVSSDLRRATSTAAELAKLTGLAVSCDARLRERFYGEWQGHALTEIAERWPDAYARWRAGEPVGDAGVETVEDLAKRVSAALQEVAGGASTVIVAMHGGAARHGVAALLGWPESATRTLGPLDNCHWTELHFGAVRGWQLRAHNVT